DHQPITRCCRPEDHAATRTFRGATERVRFRRPRALREAERDLLLAIAAGITTGAYRTARDGRRRSFDPSAWSRGCAGPRGARLTSTPASPGRPAGELASSAASPRTADGRDRRAR